jgi:HTH-type transcriptional regulator / antitoxin HipB
MAGRPKDSVKLFPYGKITGVEDIGAAIRAKRGAIGMQQEQLAALAGVGPRFLSEVENGKASAEIGKVLQVLRRLGLEVSIAPRGGGASNGG